ncbi:MAG: YIP1 family protein [Chloroflexota bacterium]|nr:YIP1 family protein [Chloroflexota bacterium]
MTATRRRTMVDRMKGAAMLDIATYEEVEADSTATGQAAGVVVIVAVASAIGALGRGGPGIIGGLLAAIVGWLIWAGVTYLIGGKLLGGTATWGELLRTLGFAQTPGVLNVLGIIPLLGSLIRFAVLIWVLVAGIIAIRQALDFSTGKAVLTALLGWLALAIVTVILAVTGLR